MGREKPKLISHASVCGGKEGRGDSAMRRGPEKSQCTETKEAPHGSLESARVQVGSTYTFKWVQGLTG